MSSLAIVNCEIYTPDEHIPHGLIWVEGDRIRAVGAGPDVPLPSDVQVIDAQGGRITPGLIDLCWRGEGKADPLVHGIANYAHTDAVRSEEDLALVSQAAAALTHTPTSARPLGLHLRLAGDAPAWEDLWTAADAAIALVTLPAAHPRTPSLARQLLAAGVKIVLDEPSHDPFLRDLLICGLAALSPDPALAASPPRSLARYLLVSAAEAPHYAAAGDLLLASGPNRPLSDPALAFPHLLAAATRQPAAFLGLPYGRLAPGAPADLACWARPGELAWAMVGGRMVSPGEHAITSFLQEQEGTLEVRNVAALPAYQASGVDLIWRFRQKDGHTETVTIAVQTDASQDDDHLRLNLPPTRADWYFYHFPATHTLYCLPTKATRVWSERNQKQSSPSAEPRVVAASELLAAIPRARRLHMTHPA